MLLVGVGIASKGFLLTEGTGHIRLTASLQSLLACVQQVDWQKEIYVKMKKGQYAHFLVTADKNGFIFD